MVYGNLGGIMNFKITNNEDDSIKVEIELTVSSWEELSQVMIIIDDKFGLY